MAIRRQVPRAGINTKPTVFYCKLDKTEIVTNQDGQHLQAFSQKPDATKLKGNYDKEFIQKYMKLQGIKVRITPVISLGQKAVGYPAGKYGYCIEAFKNATFQLKIDDTPVFSWKGSALIGSIQSDSGALASDNIKIYHTQKENVYRVFKDTGGMKEITTNRNNLVKVTIDLMTKLTSTDVPDDFAITVYLLADAEYSVYAG